jgi:hypothetical protein
MQVKKSKNELREIVDSIFILMRLSFSREPKKHRNGRILHNKKREQSKDFFIQYLESLGHSFKSSDRDSLNLYFNIISIDETKFIKEIETYLEHSDSDLFDCDIKDNILDLKEISILNRKKELSQVITAIINRNTKIDTDELFYKSDLIKDFENWFNSYQDLSKKPVSKYDNVEYYVNHNIDTDDFDVYM